MMYSNKKDSLDDIFKNKTVKRVILLITACFLVSIFILAMLYINVTRIVKLDIDSYKQIDLNNYVCKIKNVTKENGKINIEGYIYRNNVDIKIVATHLVLKDDNNYYRIPTYVKYLEQLVGDNNYGWAGFVSVLDTKKININENYKVYILSSINEEEFLIDLNLSLKEVFDNA